MEKGEVLAELYASDQEKLKDAVKYLKTAYQYSDAAVTPMEEIIGYVTRDYVQQRIINHITTLLQICNFSKIKHL